MKHLARKWRKIFRLRCGIVPAPHPSGQRSAFTIIELLVAITLTIIILALLTQMIGSVSTGWKRVNNNAKAFESARAAYEALARNLSQATLGAYYEYYNSNRVPYPLAANASASVGVTVTNAFMPTAYGRYSSLHFISGTNLVPDQISHAIFFQSPLDFSGQGTSDSASGQLNAVGYFIQYTNDLAGRPSHLTDSIPAPRTRFRLMQYLQPTQKLAAYQTTNQSWIADAASEARPFAENIICLVLWPKKTDQEGGVTTTNLIAPGYTYNSRADWAPGAAKQPVQMHQLPPTVRILMVAIDEASAQRLTVATNYCAGLFADPALYQTNLDVLESRLRDARVEYRVFQSDIPIRAAKWSE